jgi:Family of unknown function (DUF5681)
MSHTQKHPQKYDIGYGRPPIAGRFQKGHSGHRAGKAPGHLNLKTELSNALGERVWVTENGVRRLLPRQTIIVRRLVNDAAKGDARAREQLLRFLDRIEANLHTLQIDIAGAQKDAEIMARFRAEIIKKAKEES